MSHGWNSLACCSPTFDRSVHRIVAQPFLMRVEIDGELRRHIPDFLLVTAAGPVVVDVKPYARLQRRCPTRRDHRPGGPRSPDRGPTPRPHTVNIHRTASVVKDPAEVIAAAFAEARAWRSYPLLKGRDKP